ncbi:transposase [Acidihalobacter ferrooxydans]|uniref:transposase n=1 Tax=Acidihalobacter ferrooxydans TaxID=1765967 RepID=UPI0009F8565B
MTHQATAHSFRDGSEQSSLEETPCLAWPALPNVPPHIIRRSKHRQACLYADENDRFYRDWLREYAGKTGCRIHACILMTHHGHRLVFAERSDAPSAVMSAIFSAANAAVERRKQVLTEVFGTGDSPHRLG